VTPERWQRVKKIFSVASTLPDAERSAYLGEACGDDTGLRAEVSSLLDAHDDDKEAIVDRSAAEHITGDFAAEEHWLGRRIGSYEIVALLGHGGMADVYRARRVDSEYDKEVAIKLVPGGYHKLHLATGARRTADSREPRASQHRSPYRRRRD
jgi:serine/threonine-protein kinase